MNMKISLKISHSPYVAFLLSLFLVGCAVHSVSHTNATITDTNQGLISVENAGGAQLANTGRSTDQNADEENVVDDPSPEESNSGGDAQVEESALDMALELTSTSQDYWASGDTEKAIDSLDQAYAMILKVPSDADGKSLQQKDDLRFLVSKRLMEIYTSRLTTVNGLNKEIPLVINEHVEREIKLFQTQERDFFLESYKRSGRYRDEMVKAFHDAGLPEEITWLGLWQFIPSTGYKFGLKRNAWVDERLDPEKSTAAAIAYLKELHQVFGDWATVLAAYNCGEGNVFRVIRQQKVNYLDNFWDLYQRLPQETARYYPRFLAVLAILKDPAKYGFTLDDGQEKSLPYEIVSIDKPVHLKTVAEKIGCSKDDLMDLNPELRQAATPNSVYDLKVPFGLKGVLLACINSLPNWSPPQPKYTVHRVRRGDTLSTIATKYHSSIQRIMEANNIRRAKLLRIGKKLKIPLRDAT
jgi:membrane-bound lytic murein transglycosylase D